MIIRWCDWSTTCIIRTTDISFPLLYSVSLSPVVCHVACVRLSLSFVIIIIIFITVVKNCRCSWRIVIIVLMSQHQPCQPFGQKQELLLAAISVCLCMCTCVSLHKLKTTNQKLMLLSIYVWTCEPFLANVNSRSRSELTFTFGMSSSVRLSSVCNVRAPYSGDWNFPQYFYAIRYIGHLWPLYKNFTEIVPGEPLRRGLNARGVAKYSDFGPVEGYISETVQHRR